KNWPQRLGTPPKCMISGVPDHVDGRMLAITEQAGGSIINRDRMWHYVEGIRNWAPLWTDHAIRILPGPSSLWLDARGKRLPVPLYPGFDTLGTLSHIMSTGFDYSWFILPVTGADFVLDLRQFEHEIRARDRQLDNPFSKDMQITALRGARAYLGDRLIRTAKPHKMLDPANGPLIAVRLNILTRKTLGGLHTDLDSRVLGTDGQPVEGLYAVGEAAGFGGGGMHGYAALEGTFLGGCIFSGRSAGRSASRAVG
ncbi:MAG: FAD-binding protein, partial [Mesorhizobium sp.]